MNCGSNVDPDLFFRPDSEAAAVAVCDGCPLAESCRQGARDRIEPWGVWGGEDPVSRAVWVIRNDATMSHRRKAWDALLAVLAERGITDAEGISAATGIARRVVSAHLNPDTREARLARKAVALKMYAEDGKGPTEIARHLGVGRHAVQAMVKRAGLTRGRGNRVAA